MIDVVTDQLAAIWKHFRYTIYLYREGREQMWNKQKHKFFHVCARHMLLTRLRTEQTQAAGHKYDAWAQTCLQSIRRVEAMLDPNTMVVSCLLSLNLGIEDMLCSTPFLANA